MNLDPAHVDELFRILHQIPRESREFAVSSAEVQRRFGISEPLLMEMVELGFPVQARNGDLNFEAADLRNLSFYGRTGINYRTIGRFWPAALKCVEERSDISYELSYLAKCPPPGHDSCRFEVLTPFGDVLGVAAVGPHSGSIYKTEITLSGDLPELPDEARSLVDKVASFRLTWLPRSLQLDTAFMSKTGLASCMGAALILVDEGLTRGVEVRSAFGLLASAPYASIHFWAEIKVGQVWVPVDPLMIGAMLRWGVLEPRMWSPYSSLGGILCRFTEDYT